LTKRERKQQDREFLRRTYGRGVLGVVNRAAMMYEKFAVLAASAKKNPKVLAKLDKRFGNLQGGRITEAARIVAPKDDHETTIAV
jgi:hypothetical protein